jgi:L-asparaginase II
VSSEPFVVEVVRSGAVESAHLVDVAVVDRGGEPVAWAGDPDRPAAFRSSAKPIQARASREAGWEPADRRALAIACASHNGEPEHIEAVRALLSAAGVPPNALRCPADVPLYMPAALTAGAPAPIFHNCSGKHAAMLAACAAGRWPLDGYQHPEHPLQQQVRALVGSFVGPLEGPLVDGCGVPTFVAPLRGLAHGFLGIDGGEEAAAMREHPFLVGGTGRLDTDLMRASRDLLCKGGAEGLLCVAAVDVGIALKARDGAARARGPVAVEVLRALDVIGDAEIEALRTHAEPAVLGGGELVGRLRARGSIDRRS